MKIKNKGKVHPSPSSSAAAAATTTTASSSHPIFPTLHLLPAAVLTLASLLPPPDQEVLSYLLARSLHLSSSSPSNRKSSSSSAASSPSAAHRSPSFDCDCFDCYTIYWLRWDSSPNRDLIHRVIDAFEDHLSSSSSSSSSSNSSSSSSVVPLDGKIKVGSRRGGGRRGKDRTVNREKREQMDTSSRESGGDAAGPQEKKVDKENVAAAIEDSLQGSLPPTPRPLSPPPGVVSRGGGGDHKGLARKVLPDVLGILNSRLWNLWSPNA